MNTKHVKINKLNLKMLLTTCGMVAGAASPVFGEETKQQPPMPQHPVAIEEVLVTAQKRIENIQDVPKQVDVVTQAELQKTGVTSIGDLSSAVPSVSSTASGSQNTSAPAIRGVKTFASSVGVQSQTGVLVDEIAQPTFSTLANSLVDIERVEVFAGPQSVMSGRNAAGGLISLTTRAPSSKPELDLGFVQTNDEETRFTLFGTGPLSDTVSGSVSGYVDRRNGDIYSPYEDKHIGDTDDRGARGKLRWEPIDALSATLTAYYVESHTEVPAVYSSGGWSYVDPSAKYLFSGQTVAQAFPLWNGDGFSKTTFSPEFGTQTTRDRGVSLHVDYDIDRLGTFSSLTNYQKSNQPNDLVLIGEPRDVISSTVGWDNLHAYSDIQTKYFSQEVRLVSEDMDPWTYLVGAIYSDSNLTEPYFRPQALAVNWDRTDEIKTAALFGRATYNLTEVDSLTGGLRYQHDQSDYTWRFNADPVPPDNNYSGNSSYGFWGGELSFKHFFTSDVNAYITLAESETGEAYDLDNQNGVKLPGGLQPIPSEKVKNIEIGLKSHLFQDRVIFNINGFWAKYDNYQVQQTELDLSSGGITLPIISLKAVGKVETKGVELSTSFQATDALRLDLNAAYTKATIVDYPNADCWAFQTAAEGCTTSAAFPKGTQDISGASMPDAPEWKANLAADYMIFLPSLPFDGDVGAFYRYQSKVHYDTLNNPYTEQDGYGVLNLYAGINTHDDRYQVQLFVNNALDKQYYTNKTVDPFFTSQVISGSAPRDAFRYAGIRFNAKFE